MRYTQRGMARQAAMLAFLLGAGFAATAQSGGSGPGSDDFDDNFPDPFLWTAGVAGSGPTIAEQNQRVEIVLPPGSKNDPTTPLFAGGYGSKCKLRGDLDIRVGFELTLWPAVNQVRVGMGLDGLVNVQRRSASSEAYLTHFADGIHGVSTSDMAGTLRLARSGASLTGYYFDSTISDWVAIHTGPAPPGDVSYDFGAWSHEGSFSNQEVRVAFDDFEVSQGGLVCDGLKRVDIDVKPGSDPNCINTNSNGVIPVAVLGSATLDVHTIDPSTVQLEGLGIKLVGRSGRPLVTFDDVNSDGHIDAVYLIQNVAGALSSLGATATLTGELFSGEGIFGIDSVCILGA